jgi:predicted adenylyl cyclase CyaB
MGLNLEIKIKLESRTEIMSKISSMGASYVDTLHQKDTYYHYKYGLLKLREESGFFSLIKYNRMEDTKDRWSNYSILEIYGENINNYLSEIFDEEIVVKKERRLYMYKNTRIHFDKVENLGEFIELETVVENISRDEARIEFITVRDLLELNLSNEIRKSYRDLIIEKNSG